MLEVHVKISCFRAKAQLVFHSLWCLYNKSNNLSQLAIRDMPTHEHKLVQIFARLNIASRVVSINYVTALGGFICSIREWSSHLPLEFLIVFEPKKVKKKKNNVERGGG